MAHQHGLAGVSGAASHVLELRCAVQRHLGVVGSRLQASRSLRPIHEGRWNVSFHTNSGQADGRTPLTANAEEGEAFLSVYQSS
jgi:hypothetical protein